MNAEEQTPHYSLVPERGTDGGWISRDCIDTGARLQGDDFWNLRQGLDAIWENATITRAMKCRIEDSILSLIAEQALMSPSAQSNSNQPLRRCHARK